MTEAPKDLKVDGRVSRAQRLRESRRAAVLAVARRLFSQKGYHATSIHDIIEAAEIARGTFYLYFESKRAIFDELLDGLVIVYPAARDVVGADAFADLASTALVVVDGVLAASPALRWPSTPESGSRREVRPFWTTRSPAWPLAM